MEDFKGRISELLKMDVPCRAYEEGEQMWTDPYISSQMLRAHLDETSQLASYKPQRREKVAVCVIEGCALKDGSKLLDLGCGPGMYSRLFASHGIQYTGVDISRQSLGYATVHRGEFEDSITYRQMDYRNLDYNSEFDACCMIWCDFGVLSPEGVQSTLKGIMNALKPGSGVRVRRVFRVGHPRYAARTVVGAFRGRLLAHRPASDSGKDRAVRSRSPLAAPGAGGVR